MDMCKTNTDNHMNNVSFKEVALEEIFKLTKCN